MKIFNNDWDGYLCPQFQQPYMKQLMMFLQMQIKQGKKITPSMANVFRAYRECSYTNTQVVVIGQDPYPEGVADGIAFSSSIGFETPYSLQKIHEAIEETVLENKLSLNLPNDLTSWARQGILMLNTSFTTELNRVGAHTTIGWNWFLIATIQWLNYKDNILWVLLGQEAKQYSSYITNKSHKVVTAEHPAASRYRGDFRWNHNNCMKEIHLHFKIFHSYTFQWEVFYNI